MDLIMQMGTQSHCLRFAEYFHLQEQIAQLGGTSTVFPPGPFADAAEVLGNPRNHANGPCLVQLSNIQLTPQAFNKWFVGSFVERPCTRVFWLQRSIPTAESRAALIQAVTSAPLPGGITSVRMDVYPRSITAELVDDLQAAGYSTPMHPVSCSHVLCVVQLPGTKQYRWSYIERQQLWRMASDRPARFHSSVATAINKVAEAMQVIGLGPTHQLQQQQLEQQQQQQSSCSCSMHELGHTCSSQREHNQQPPQDGLCQQQQQQQQRWAIDIGACPGGWTSYLAGACGYTVIAIDPGQLHPDVVARPNVHFVKRKSADAVGQVQELLQGKQADLLVCDANDHFNRLPDFLGPVLPSLKPGGWLVLTLKFHGKGLKDDRVSARLAELLPEVEPGLCVWLFANTLCERTYLARKRLE